MVSWRGAGWLQALLQGLGDGAHALPTHLLSAGFRAPGGIPNPDPPTQVPLNCCPHPAPPHPRRYEQYITYGGAVLQVFQMYRLVVLPVANTWMSWRRV